MVVEHPTIALTGATGFLGSHLMAALLKNGHRVIVLGRSSVDATLVQRLTSLLKWFGIEGLTDRLEMVEIDFSRARLGLEQPIYNTLCTKTDQIIHCASDTSFSEHRRQQVFASNVLSLNHVLNFADDARVEYFHYISTAYACGQDSPICMEQLPHVNHFLNVYEESKAQAEKAIAQFCDQQTIPYTIIRPTIVYGDSRTGRSLKFNALYYPIRSLMALRDIYLNDIQNNGGKRSRAHGIGVGEDGYLFLPLKIVLPKSGGLNLIPVNYFVEATLRILKNACSGAIYHLSNKIPVKLETIISYNEPFMRMKGVEIAYAISPNSNHRNPVAELFDRYIKAYLPYMHDDRHFDRTNTDKATSNLQPATFSKAIFKRCMEYAVAVEWGEHLNQPASGQ
ncbi:MAG: SDR family oxidoreductase [Bacteroidales bacterium]|nr:SDR family oxidoreductase [Bacteroidales bacterium]